MPYVARCFAAACALFAAAPLVAQDRTAPAPAPAAPAAPATPPRLLVVISVDQFSADLFAEYREHFTGGFARLLTGAVFPAGYQGHAATETCPGHSTILTGDRPARTGIIANDWIDLETAREDKVVYCAEDESVPGSSSSSYTVSDKHLKVPTLGEWMKGADAAARVFSVAGKDRAAVMMGGHKVDELWWWDGKALVSYAGRATPPVVGKINGYIAARIAEPTPAYDLPNYCRTKDRAVPIGGGKSVGTGRFARAAGDAKAFRASPEFDEAIVSLAGGLITEAKLGQGNTTDLIAIGASATDYVGHTYGTEGTEMCIQLFALDQTLGKLFAVLDRTGVDYAVALTADHGGHDLPERNRDHGIPEAQRIDAGLSNKAMNAAVTQETGLSGQLLSGGVAGDIWINPELSAQQRAQVSAAAAKWLSAQPQVKAVFTREAILATPAPAGPPETWTLIERARASFDADRSGDLVVALNPRVTPIADPTGGYVATHGSFWDYDRRVPMLFWRKGMASFEQPLSVETVDIAPTLAALIGLTVPVAIDGRCLDLDAGAGSTCPR